MYRSAQEALDNSDMDMLLKINEELQSVGYSLQVRGGSVRLTNNTYPQVANSAQEFSTPKSRY